jgi:hypothetical protein
MAHLGPPTLARIDEVHASIQGKAILANGEERMANGGLLLLSSFTIICLFITRISICRAER